MDILEQVQQRAMKMIKELEHLGYKEMLKARIIQLEEGSG